MYLPSANTLGFATNSSPALYINSSGNVGIGTATPNSNAILQLYSTSKGFLPPLLTTANETSMGTSLPTGLVVYNTTNNELESWNGTAWEAVGSNAEDAGGSNTQLQYNNGGDLGGTAGLTWDNTNDALTLATIANPAASALTVTGGALTGTTSYPALNVTQTWNNASGNFTGILENVTNTASVGTSKLMDIQVGGTSKFNVGANGNVGIGITSPSVSLDISGQLRTGSLAGPNASNYMSLIVGQRPADDNFSTIRFGAQSGARGWSFDNFDDGTSAQYFQIYDAVNSATRLLINNGGNVGIGTTSPNALLDIGNQKTTNGAMRLESSAAGGYFTQIQPSASQTAAWTMTLPVSAGTSGYVLQTDGTGVTSWVAAPATGVTSFSAGTTGFTPSTATTGAVTLAGTLNVANGGTGAATAPAYSVFGNNTSSTAAPAFQTSITLVGSTIETLQSIGTTSTDGIMLYNTTAAANNAQQYSPRLHFEGQGWKTTATAASQAVDFVQEVQPVQGTTAPTGNLVWSASVGTASLSPLMTLTSGGNVGIGRQLAPNYPLHIVATTNQTLEVDSNNATGTSIQINNTSTGGHNMQFFSTGSGNNAGQFGVYDASSTKALFALNGETPVLPLAAMRYRPLPQQHQQMG